MKRYFILTVIMGAILSLLSCGKVTQEATIDKQSPSFSVTYAVSDIFVPTSNLKVREHPDYKSPAAPNQFIVEDPTFAVIKGYKKNKGDDLAWGKGVAIREKVKASKSKSKGPSFLRPKVKDSYRYVSTAFDKKEREITAKPKKTQIKADYSDRENSWGFSAEKLSKKYDMYLFAAYTSDEVYRLKVVDHATVSSNQMVKVGDISELDTFQGLLFLQSLGELPVDADLLTQLFQLFNMEFFMNTTFPFPSLNQSGFSIKKPRFLLGSPFLDECISVLDLSRIDREEAERYITDNANKVFSKKQQRILRDNLATLSGAKP